MRKSFAKIGRFMEIGLLDFQMITICENAKFSQIAQFVKKQKSFAKFDFAKNHHNRSKKQSKILGSNKKTSYICEDFWRQ